MNRLTQLMHHHHAACDDVFAATEAAARAGDWPGCELALARFEGTLLAHLRAEEERLFPAFEARTGMSEGPTRVMRDEHARMREILGWMRESCAARDGDGFADAAETLLILMQQHNMKEENILYPMCDRALGGEPVFPELLAEVEHALADTGVAGHA